MRTLKSCYKLKEGCHTYDFEECIYYLLEQGELKYPEFRIAKTDLELYYKLLCYAIEDETQCEKYGIDLKKGILLTGPVGCGKTSLMTLFHEFHYPEKRYQMISTRTIAEEFNKDGYEVIQKYGRRKKVICLDDLGVEGNMKHFGNECNTTAEILLHRYDMHVAHGIVTHATTNLNSDELEKLYGSRVRSRLRSMFNLIAFPADTIDKRR